MQKPDWWLALELGDARPFEAFLKAAHDPAPGERDFAQDDLLLLGGSRPVCLRSNREKALSSRLAFGGRLSRPRSVNVVLKPLGETFAADERLAALQAIPVRQFVCRPGAHLDLALPGALVPFACAPGLVHGLLRRGAPWVLSFDAVRSADEDLANVAVRDRVMRLVTALLPRRRRLSPCQLLLASHPARRSV